MTPSGMAAALFNGGKQQHIFKLDNNLYVNEYHDEAARAALREGRAFVKIDGANHMVHKQADGRIALYARFDARSGAQPEDCVLLPEGGNETVYTSKHQTHAYFYKPVVDVMGKLGKLYPLLEAGAAKHLADRPEGWYSVEAVGRKFQRTPGVDADAALAFHADQVLDLPQAARMGLAECRAFLLEQVCIEGIVLEHRGVFWKVRSNCLSKTCAFEAAKKSGRLPDNFVRAVVVDR